MFERCTDQARRVIFFGGYAAAQVGSPYIETEHVLLGLLREDKALANRFFGSLTVVASPRTSRSAFNGAREHANFEA
jgi:ATP-dependent Clp protease ATP-binding subunit ClpC